MEKSFNQWLQNFQQQRLPLWHELPHLDLYMDQVIQEVNTILVPIVGIETTKTMINSYVKHGIVERPIQKKYQRRHLIEILIVSLIKTNYSLDTIKLGIEASLSDKDPQAAYDAFATLVNDELAYIELESFDPALAGMDAHVSVVQKYAVKSVLYKLVATKLIESLLPKENQIKKKKK